MGHVSFQQGGAAHDRFVSCVHGKRERMLRLHPQWKVRLHGLKDATDWLFENGMNYHMVLAALGLIVSGGTWACAQDRAPRLTGEACARLEAAFYERPRSPEIRSFYQSAAYRQCREAAFAMDPLAGIELLEALSGEGESLDWDCDLHTLEKRLFHASIGTVTTQPQYMQRCYRIEQDRWCRGVLADDSEHHDALLFGATELKAGTPQRLTLHTDKPHYVLQQLFLNEQAVTFRQTGRGTWEATLSFATNPQTHHPSDVYSLSAIFTWDGQGADPSRLGTFRKAVWYYAFK